MDSIPRSTRRAAQSRKIQEETVGLNTQLQEFELSIKAVNLFDPLEQKKIFSSFLFFLFRSFFCYFKTTPLFYPTSEASSNEVSMACVVLVGVFDVSAFRVSGW